MAYIILAGIFLIFCCSACNKKKIDHYVLSDNFKQWYAFKKGSFWIYKNEPSNILDSAFAFNFLSYTANDKEDYYGYIYDVCSNKIISSFIDAYSLQAEKNFEFIDIATNMSEWGTAYRNDVPLRKKIQWYNGFYELSDVYDSLIINNIVFRNVIHTKTVYEYAHHQGDSIYLDYYISRNIGLIKFEQHLEGTDSVWSLLRWKTIQ